MDFRLSIIPSKEIPGLISFRMDWLDLLAEEKIPLKSLLQHHNSKASIPRHSAFFMLQLSHPYMTTGKTREANGVLMRGLPLQITGDTVQDLFCNCVSKRKMAGVFTHQLPFLFV